jgi:phosphoesterase RecJ-like protein
MNDFRNSPLQKVVDSIHQKKRFLVATHVRPDGDAAGSLLGLTFILRQLGKEVHPFAQDPVPPNYHFLPGIQEIRCDRPQLDLYDAAILVDCGDFGRVGETLGEAIRPIPYLINIDHHVSGSPFGDVFWVESKASSTCEMLYNLATALQVRLDPEIATQLYTGLLTDTGSFRYSNTNGRVLQIAGDLVATGADPAGIAQAVYDSGTPQRLHLLGQVLSTISFHAGDLLATASLTQRMLRETQTSPLDGEGFINHLRSVQSVKIAILFREGSNGTIHVSFRSKGDTEVSVLAQRHGGGGHKNAAAFRVQGTIEGVRSAVTTEAVEALGQVL